MVAVPLIDSFRSMILSRRYPDRKLVKVNAEQYLTPFSGGICVHSRVVPSKGGMRITARMDMTVMRQGTIFGMEVGISKWILLSMGWSRLRKRKKVLRENGIPM